MSSRRFTDPEDVMAHALALAEKGQGSVEPNPPVGAVLVDDDLQLLGTGFHQQFGGPHAEVNAIAATGDACRGATMYVTLEPCAHHGKTPPCVDAVVEAGIRRVIVAVKDPVDHGSGSGIDRLRAEGVEVEVGLLQEQAERLIAPWATFQLQQRPYVHAKWAMTLDGRIASRTGHSQWISNASSRALVHRLRGRMDAIIVGIGTVLADDPLLTARPPGPRQAVRIVLDHQGRLPLQSRLVQTASDVPVLVVLSEQADSSAETALKACGIETIRIRSVPDQAESDLEQLLRELARRDMTNVLVEGGSGVLGSFFDAGFIDEYHVFIAPKVVGGKGAMSPIAGVGREQIPEHAYASSACILESDVYLRCWTRRPVDHESPPDGQQHEEESA